MDIKIKKRKTLFAEEESCTAFLDSTWKQSEIFYSDFFLLQSIHDFFQNRLIAPIMDILLSYINFRANYTYFCGELLLLMWRIQKTEMDPYFATYDYFRNFFLTLEKNNKNIFKIDENFRVKVDYETGKVILYYTWNNQPWENKMRLQVRYLGNFFHPSVSLPDLKKVRFFIENSQINWRNQLQKKKELFKQEKKKGKSFEYKYKIIPKKKFPLKQSMSYRKLKSRHVFY